MSDDGYQRYLFEYRFDGAEWGIEITARSPQEAKERIAALTWARYKGEIKTKIPVPGAGLIQRITARWLNRSHARADSIRP
jgi:hypothetical protein